MLSTVFAKADQSLLLKPLLSQTSTSFLNFLIASFSSSQSANMDTLQSLPPALSILFLHSPIEQSPCLMDFNSYLHVDGPKLSSGLTFFAEHQIPSQTAYQTVPFGYSAVTLKFYVETNCIISSFPLTKSFPCITL